MPKGGVRRREGVFMARKAGVTAGSLRGLSSDALQAELRRRMSRARQLQRSRERLVNKLRALDQAIIEAGGSVRGGAGDGFAPRKRAKNDSNLTEALAKLLKGKTMSVTDAAEAVQKAGYKTTAANFRTIVNQTLIKHKTIFKKVSRGQYTAA